MNKRIVHKKKVRKGANQCGLIEKEYWDSFPDSFRGPIPLVPNLTRCLYSLFIHYLTPFPTNSKLLDTFPDTFLDTFTPRIVALGCVCVMDHSINQSIHLPRTFRYRLPDASFESIMP